MDGKLNIHHVRTTDRISDRPQVHSSAAEEKLYSPHNPDLSLSLEIHEVTEAMEPKSKEELRQVLQEMWNNISV